MMVKEETLIAEGMKEEDNYLKTAKVKMDQVREENERLKMTLSRMMKSYHSLKMQFKDIVKEDDHQPKKSADESDPFVSLSLGIFSGDHSNRDGKIKTDYCNESKIREINDGAKLDGLELGLDCKFHAAGNSTHDHHQLSKTVIRSPENYSSDESKEEGNSEKPESRKSPKNSRSGDDEILQLQNPLKKPRVSVRAVCNTQTMHDGCQWRKYGQKISKGNPCPRAYYRCTVSPSCPVRKQVQRCMDDMTILVTTYEGAHNHTLSPTATTMASATSAAAAMLNSGSTTSPPCGGVSATSSSTSLGFNFTSSNNFPRATISTSQSHPTVVLDLTPPNHSNNNNNSSAQNSKLFSSSTFLSTPTNSLNFSAPSNSPYSQPFIYSNFSQQQIIANDDHKFSAATKAITRDPTFQSALAAAITSFVGNNVQGRNSGLNFDLSFTQPSTSNGSIGCATSFLNKFPQSVDYQHKNMTHFAPLTLMSSSKSQAMVSLADEAEQIKL